MKFFDRIIYAILAGSLGFLVSLNIFSGEGNTQKFDCLSFVVGKKASADGSVIFTHNEDTGPFGVNCYKVPRKTHQQGMERLILPGHIRPGNH